MDIDLAVGIGCLILGVILLILRIYRFRREHASFSPFDLIYFTKYSPVFGLILGPMLILLGFVIVMLKLP